MAKILVIGCGDIGAALAGLLVKEGHEVIGLKRTIPTKKSALTYIQADVTKITSLQSIAFDVDQVVYILSPSAGDIAAYRAVFERGVSNVLSVFQQDNPKVSFTFVSSTRVYGQTKGEWLDESSPTEPTDERGQILLAGEKKFLAFNDKTTIVRFSGIYGRTNYFLKQLKKGVEIQKQPPYYTNRIHREDCIGVLAFLLAKKIDRAVVKPIYLATDYEPAKKWELACYLADVAGLQRSAALTLADDATRNKRLSNRLLVSEGYAFKYGSYKQGYSEAINEQL